MLLRPYRETQQTFQAVAGIDVPSWRSWAMCVTSVGSTVVGMVPALRALALVLFELLSLLIVLCLWRLEALLVLRRWFCILGFYSASIPILSLLFIFSSFSVSPSVPPSVTAASAPPRSFPVFILLTHFLWHLVPGFYFLSVDYLVFLQLSLVPHLSPLYWSALWV